MSRLFAFLLALGLGTASAEEVVERFDDRETGYPPEELFVIDGNFDVVAQGEGKVLRLKADPIIECGVLFGKSSKGAMTAEAKVLASKRGRRSFPRFGLGIHGVSGHRVRVTPARKCIELVHEEEVVTTAPFTWKSGEWCHLKLKISLEEDKATLEAWAWMEGDEAPQKPSLTHESEASASGQGKASVWGTPYSGKEILYDDLKVSSEEAK